MQQRLLPLLALSALARPCPPQDTGSALDDLAARAESTRSLHERVELARLGRRLDPGGSVWWFELEARARLQAGEPVATVRLCDEALSVPLADEDGARMHRLRAEAFARLRDSERELGDLAQVVRLDPGDRASRARLHGLLAQRLRERRVRRDVLERTRDAAANPELPEAHLALARALDRAGRDSEASAAYLEANHLDPALLDGPDHVRLAHLLLPLGELYQAEVSLDRAAQLDPGARLDDVRAELEEARRSLEFNTASGYGGYEEEGGWEGGFVEESGQDPGPPSPPSELDEAGMAAMLVRWTAVADELTPWPDAHFAPFLDADLRWSALAVELHGVTESAALEALQPRIDALRQDLAAFFHVHAPLEARYTTALQEALAWGEWCQEHEDRGHGPAPGAEAILAAQERLLAIGSPQVLRIDEQLESLLEQRITQVQGIESLRLWTRELLEQREQLAPQDVLTRARTLLALGEPSTVLLALQGLAEHDLGLSGEALVALHASLANPEPHALEEEVLAVLDELQARGQGLVPVVEHLEQEGPPEAALSLAERAADLACLDPWTHVLEARVHAARVPQDLGEELEALRAVRLASALGPDDRRVLTAHLQLALAARELSEARDAADRLLALDPRDPALILERVPVLILCGESDLALQEWRVAYEASGRQDVPSSTPTWAGERLRRWGLGPYPGYPWDPSHTYPFLQRLAWLPGSNPSAPASKALADRLLACLLSGADLDTLDAPPEGLTEREAWEWPAVSLYYRAEVTHVLGEYKDKVQAFEKALAHPALPVQLAYLSGLRAGRPLRRRQDRSHLPLRVPQEAQDLATALRGARSGQELILGPGTHEMPESVERSLRLRGVGSELTRLRRTFYASSRPTLLDPKPANRNGFEIHDGWVELADLSWDTELRTDAAEDRARLRHVLRRGSLSLEDCTLGPDTGIDLGPRTRALLLDCRVGEGGSPALTAQDAHLTLHRVSLGRPIELAGAAHLEAEALFLRSGGALDLNGSECRGVVRRATSRGGGESQLRVAEGARLEVSDLVHLGRAGTALASGDGVRLGRVELLGGSDLGSAEATEVLDLAVARDARAEEPLRVANVEELRRARFDGRRHLLLQPGTYELGGDVVDDQLVLRGVGDGVVLQTPIIGHPHVLEVTPNGQLWLEDVTLDLRMSREPEPGDPLFGSGGVYLLDDRHPAYHLLEVQGRVRLERCSERARFVDESTPRKFLARLGGDGLLVSHDLLEGSALTVADQARALLVDGGVRTLQVTDAGRVQLGGSGDLRRIEVQGADTEVRLDDQRRHRLKFSAFRGGAPDPRSDLQRRRDGLDPEVLSRESLARARERWLDPIAADWPSTRAAEHMAAYAEEHERALRCVEADPDARARATALALGARLVGQRDLQREVLSRLGYGRTWDALVYRVLDVEDRNAYFARNRALHALGDGASARDVNLYATWEEEILAGRAQREQMDEARALGMSPAAYQLELARRERVAALAEAEAEAALASGDKERIRGALQAISMDRWLEHVTRDDNATLTDVQEALAASTGSEWRYYLEHKQRGMEWDLRRRNHSSAQASWGGSGFQVQYAAPNTDFQNWTKDFNTRMQSMDNSLREIQSSSYSSYRNRYEY